jgi:cysteinyl-tRNA synthetase
VISILKELDSILGIFKIQAHPNESLINKLVAEREVFRQKKDFGEADRIRNILKEMGVFIVDTAKGNFWTWV